MEAICRIWGIRITLARASAINGSQRRKIFSWRDKKCSSFFIIKVSWAPCSFLLYSKSKRFSCQVFMLRKRKGAVAK